MKKTSIEKSCNRKEPPPAETGRTVLSGQITKLTNKANMFNANSKAVQDLLKEFLDGKATEDLQARFDIGLMDLKANLRHMIKAMKEVSVTPTKEKIAAKATEREEEANLKAKLERDTEDKPGTEHEEGSESEVENESDMEPEEDSKNNTEDNSDIKLEVLPEMKLGDGSNL